MSAFVSLFAASFLAATILPFYSEVVLFALLQQGYAAGPLVTIASIGNTLGAVLNWVLGRFLLRYADRRWFYFSETHLQNSQKWFQRYGKWCLLLSWMPVGGDALTFVAGVMRVRLGIFIVLVGIGKTLRYIVVVYFSDAISSLL